MKNFNTPVKLSVKLKGYKLGEDRQWDFEIQ